MMKFLMLGLVLNSAFAAEPMEILRCKSDTSILSIHKTEKNYTASLISPMKREKIEEQFPGIKLSEEMMNRLLLQKPLNQIPEEYRIYDLFETDDETVKNGFKLRGKDIVLDLIKNDQGRIDVRFSSKKVSGSAVESRSGTWPLGPFSAVECETLNAE